MTWVGAIYYRKYKSIMHLSLSLIWVLIWDPTLVAKPLRYVIESICTKFVFSKANKVFFLIEIHFTKG